MPSNHISNKPYHDWLAETNKHKQLNRKKGDKYYNMPFFIDLDTVDNDPEVRRLEGEGIRWFYGIKDAYEFGNLGKLGQGFHVYKDPEAITGTVGVVFLYEYKDSYITVKSVEELEEIGREKYKDRLELAWGCLREQRAVAAPLENARYVLSRLGGNAYVFLKPEDEITEGIVYNRRSLLFKDASFNTHDLIFNAYKETNTQ